MHWVVVIRVWMLSMIFASIAPISRKKSKTNLIGDNSTAVSFEKYFEVGKIWHYHYSPDRFSAWNVRCLSWLFSLVNRSWINCWLLELHKIHWSAQKSPSVSVSFSSCLAMSLRVSASASDHQICWAIIVVFFCCQKSLQGDSIVQHSQCDSL